MTRHWFSALLLLTLIVCVSCSPPPAADTRAADEAAIKAADEEWAAAAARNDLEATLSFYSSDAVLLAPNAPIATTPKAVRESWAGLLGPNTAVSWKATKIEVAKSGDLAYLYGTYQLTIKDPKGGPGVNDTGKILEVWKKQADGKWKCAVDTYNSDIPLAPAPAPEPAKKK